MRDKKFKFTENNIDYVANILHNCIYNKQNVQRDLNKLSMTDNVKFIKYVLRQLENNKMNRPQIGNLVCAFADNYPLDGLMLDRDMYPLIELLHSKGIETWSCCEGHSSNKLPFIEIVGFVEHHKIPSKVGIHYRPNRNITRLFVKNKDKSKDAYHKNIALLHYTFDKLEKSDVIAYKDIDRINFRCTALDTFKYLCGDNNYTPTISNSTSAFVHCLYFFKLTKSKDDIVNPRLNMNNYKTFCKQIYNFYGGNIRYFPGIKTKEEAETLKIRLNKHFRNINLEEIKW